MNTYKLLAQSFTTTQRVAKTINAHSVDHAYKIANRELEGSDYYVVECHLLQTAMEAAR